MRQRPRHTRTTITLTPLTGGINAADSPDRLAEGEMTDCTNFLYETGSQTLAPRGGLAPIATLPAPIHGLYHDTDTRTLFLFLTDRSAYRLTEGSEAVFIGTLSGTRRPSCAKFQNKLCIASGGKLQTYDYTNPITTLDSAPTADLICVRGGRLLAALTGSDRLRFSAIGDPASWDSDAGDPSSSAWLDIGYGDSGDIIAIVPLAADLIIIKSNGCIYQLSGDASPASWRVTQLASDADPIGQRTAAHIKGNVVYLSARGLVSLAATADYGNITANDLADKLRPLLADPAHSARLYALPRRGLLLIQPHTDQGTLIAYHSARGAATRLTFAVPVSDLCETASAIHIASGNTLYRLSTDTHTDNNAPIDYRISLRHLRGSGRLCLTRIDAHLTCALSGTVQLTADNADHTLTTDLPNNARTVRRLNHTTDCLAITLSSNLPFTAQTLSLTLAEL